jgi:hypothetical protein
MQVLKIYSSERRAIRFFLLVASIGSSDVAQGDTAIQGTLVSCYATLELCKEQCSQSCYSADRCNESQTSAYACAPSLVLWVFLMFIISHVRCGFQNRQHNLRSGHCADAPLLSRVLLFPLLRRGTHYETKKTATTELRSTCFATSDVQ